MIMFTCGGTGGHIYPAIAMAQELQEQSMFITSKTRQDAQLVPKYGFASYQLTHPRYIWTYLVNIIKAYRVFKKHKAKILISTGGGFTFPIVIAATLCRKPIILLEQNVYPGRVNRVLQFLARKVFISFPESRAYFQAHKSLCYGNPIRKTFLSDERYETFKQYNFSKKKTLLIVGGSQGAKKLNVYVQSQYALLAKAGWHVIHLTGEAWYALQYQDPLFTRIEEKNTQRVIMPYFERMDYLYRISDCVVCRAGATTISELAAYGRPAVLVPFPYAKDNHQEANAQAYVSMGLGRLVLEPELFQGTLSELIDFSATSKAQPSQAREKIAKEIKALLA